MLAKPPDILGKTFIQQALFFKLVSESFQVVQLSQGMAAQPPEVLCEAGVDQMVLAVMKRSRPMLKYSPATKFGTYRST